jgi:hypothetical protein
LQPDDEGIVESLWEKIVVQILGNAVPGAEFAEALICLGKNTRGLLQARIRGKQAELSMTHFGEDVDKLPLYQELQTLHDFLGGDRDDLKQDVQRIMQRWKQTYEAAKQRAAEGAKKAK